MLPTPPPATRTSQDYAAPAIQFRRHEQYASPHRPADTSVTGWLVEHTAVIQTAAYFCAGGFVVGLLTLAGATAVAWLLLAAALTADTATYGLRARRDRTDRDGEPR